MLRNKSPVVSSSSAMAGKSASPHADDPLGIGDNSSALLITPSSTSPKHHYKPTHRRGYSQGSLNSPQANVSLYSNVPFNSSSLNRSTTNSSSEFVDSKRATINNLMTLIGETSDMRDTSSNGRLFANDENLHTSLASPSDDQLRAMAKIESKIRQMKEEIKKEQMRCNENVNEYLKLTSNSADSTQTQRIKSVFEKNNQKSTRRIARCQKKLQRYDLDMKDIKEKGIINRHAKERLRDVGTNIREGITGLSGGVIEGIRSGIHSAGETVITKPKEFFKRTTTDQRNISEPNEQSSSGEAEFASPPVVVMPNSNSHSHSHSTKCTSDDEVSSSITSDSGHLLVYNVHNQPGGSPAKAGPAKLSNKMSAPGDAISTPTATASINHPFELYNNPEFEQLCTKLIERTNDIGKLRSEVDQQKTQLISDITIVNMNLQDEKYRVERLEEQLNDLTELHQKEIENLKQTISDLEEKVQYQTQERHRDVQEMLESFQTRISRMEHQQHQHLQQLVMLDSLDNSNARALVLKLINVVLTVLQVVLLLVATIANVLAPFLQTRMRIFTSLIVIIVFYFIIQHWPNLSHWTRQKLYDNCIYFLGFLPFLTFGSEAGT